MTNSGLHKAIEPLFRIKRKADYYFAQKNVNSYEIK